MREESNINGDYDYDELLWFLERWGWRFKRLKCFFLGCKITYWHENEYVGGSDCERCDAGEDTIGNETPALKGSLKNFIGSLSDETMKVLHQLYSSRLLNSDIPEILKKYTGLPIVAEDDPRLSFQNEEIDAVAYLAKAATASLELEIVEEETPVEMPNWLTLNIVPILGKLSPLLKKSLHSGGKCGKQR